MALDDAQLLTMIAHSGIRGGLTFSRPDGMAFWPALTIGDVIVGEAETGPLTADLASGIFALTKSHAVSDERGPRHSRHSQLRQRRISRNGHLIFTARDDGRRIETAASTLGSH